jgi:peptidoglycan/xylan/chitin deacetylase (PgdA/CDA1 family)
MYHRIAEESFDPWGLAVSPANLTDQVQWLTTNRRVLGLAEFARSHRARTLPDDAVAITFDDGYASVMEAAVPVLEQFDALAAVFIPAELIEHGDAFWWDKLERIVLDHPGSSLNVDGVVELGDRSSEDTRWPPGADPQTPRQRAFLSIWERLKLLSPKALDDAMSRVEEQAGATKAIRRSRRLLNSEDLHGRPALLDVGSHALTHPSLPALSRSEKAHEIRASIAQCEAVSGTRPSTFAYPFGDIDRESLELVRDAGFECACTTHHSFVARRTDPFSMPRLAVPNCGATGLASLLGTP